MEVGKYDRPSICSVGERRQQKCFAMNVQILNNLHVRQKQNEKKAFD